LRKPKPEKAGSGLLPAVFAASRARAGTPGFLNSITTSGRPLTKPTRSGRQM
jgi:hypothetical protein